MRWNDQTLAANLAPEKYEMYLPISIQRVNHVSLGQCER